MEIKEEDKNKKILTILVGLGMAFLVLLTGSLLYFRQQNYTSPAYLASEKELDDLVNARREKKIKELLLSTTAPENNTDIKPLPDLEEKLTAPSDRIVEVIDPILIEKTTAPKAN